MNDRSRPYRVLSPVARAPEPVPTPTPGGTDTLSEDLRSGRIKRWLLRMPPSVRGIMLGAALATGGGVTGGFAKLLQVQTVKDAAADRALLEAKIGGVVSQLQSSSTVEEQRSDVVMKKLAEIQAEQKALAQKLQALSRRMSKRTPRDEEQAP